MDSKSSHFKKWFGYNRRERRSTSILLLIITIVFISRYMVPGRQAEIENLTTETAWLNEKIFFLDSIQNDTLILFPFDPNLVSVEDLIKLGLSDKQAATVLNYRKAGGRFYNEADFGKIYGIDKNLIDRLMPFVIISDSVKTVRSSIYTKQIIPIDLNSSDSSALETLPGIGPVLAARIIKYRNILGGFCNKIQLKEVYGLSEETYDLIADRVLADSSVIKRIAVNKALYSEFLRHPYLESAEIDLIIKYREMTGPISAIGEMVENKVLTKEKAARLNPYFSFE